MKACAGTEALGEGKQLHCLNDDKYVSTVLMNMYTECNDKQNIIWKLWTLKRYQNNKNYYEQELWKKWMCELKIRV